MVSDAENKWWDEWSSRAEHRVLFWNDLENRTTSNGQSEKRFWNKIPRRSGFYTDQEMVDLGLLVEFSKNKLIHIAYIPWIYGNKKSAKINWSSSDWEKLNSHLSDMVAMHGSEMNSHKWEFLTLHSSNSVELIRNGMRNSHLIGDIDGDRIHDSRYSSNFIQGNVSGRIRSLKDVFISGSVNVSGNFSAERVRIGQIQMTNQDSMSGNVSLSDSNIENLSIVGNFSYIDIKNSVMQQFFCKGRTVSNFRLENSSIFGTLDASDANFEKRFSVFNSKLPDQSSLKNVPFDHTSFGGRVNFVGRDLRLSIFYGAKFGSTIDLNLIGGSVESVFEYELKSSLDLRRAGRTEESISLRNMLESVCQVITERHKQDGRRDLEHRFRRLEIKARSYRIDSDWDTKLLSRTYELCSDFGRSLFRPLFGIAVIYFSFFVAYWVIGSIALDLSFWWTGHLNSTVVVDALMLSADKLFPFWGIDRRVQLVR